MTVVEGIKTSIPMHLRILADPDFRAGRLSTGFMERFLAPAKRRHGSPRRPERSRQRRLAPDPEPLVPSPLVPSPCHIMPRPCRVKPAAGAGAAGAEGVVVGDAGGPLMSQLFATKSMEQLRAEAAETGEHSLKRVLGPVNLITLGIGAIIGTGIFVLTGQAAAQYAGPGHRAVDDAGRASPARSPACATPSSRRACRSPGRAYTYGYATLGEFFAWIIGWDLILEYALGAATVAVGWSGYVVSFLADFGLLIPPAYTAPSAPTSWSAPGTGRSWRRISPRS